MKSISPPGGREIRTGLDLYLNRRMLLILWLGVSSGIPLALTGGTLQAWLKEEGLSLRVLGLFSFVSLPFALKIVWAPYLDRPRTGLDRRRFWMLLAQAALVLDLALLSRLAPSAHPFTCALCALLAALAASVQDTAIDAYRTEILPTEKFGAGAAIAILGYRLGMLASGAGGLVLAEYAGWRAMYLSFALVFVLSIVITVFLAPAPDAAPPSLKKKASTFWLPPFKELLGRDSALVILSLVALYKIGDAFAASLGTAFLLESGFSKSTIGSVYNLFGAVATVAGGIAGGYFLRPQSLRRDLLIFGVLQALSTFSFVLLLSTGPRPAALALVVAFENLSAGLGTAALTCYLMLLCNREFTASQYAALTSMIAAARVLAGSVSGFVAAVLGWFWFFTLGALLALPALLLLALHSSILTNEQQGLEERH